MYGALHASTHGWEALVNYTGVAFHYVAGLFQGSGKGSDWFSSGSSPSWGGVAPQEWC